LVGADGPSEAEVGLGQGGISPDESLRHRGNRPQAHLGKVFAKHLLARC
jgi:hypothetical protein